MFFRWSILDEKLETPIDRDSIACEHNDGNDGLVDVVIDIFSVEINLSVRFVDVVLRFICRCQTVLGG